MLISQLLPKAKMKLKDWRTYVIPVEIFLFLYMFTTVFQMFFYQQYYFQYLSRERLESQPNYTFPSSGHMCLKQNYIVKYIGNSSFVALQKRINHLNMYSNIVSIGTSFLASAFLGSLSDKLGRKPVASLAIIGMVASTALQSLVVYFRWDPRIFLVALAVHGFTGGFPLLIGICFATVTDTTNRRWLGVRYSVLEATLGFGKAVASLSTNNWIHSTKCSFFYPSLLNVGVSALSLVYLAMMRETVPTKSHQSETEEQDKELLLKRPHRHPDINKLFNGLQIYFNPFYIGFSNWWRVWAAIIVICSACTCSIGGTEILNFFLHNDPLSWTYDKIGYYGAASAVFMAILLVTVFPLLVVVKVPYPIIGLISVVSGVIGNVIIALVKTDTQMYIAGIFINVLLVYPAMRACLERYVFASDRGAVFSVGASFQMLASVFSSILFNEVYQPETEVDGHKVSASTVFWIMTGIWVWCAPWLLCLQFIKHYNSQVVNGEKDPLLQCDHHNVSSPSLDNNIN